MQLHILYTVKADMLTTTQHPDVKKLYFAALLVVFILRIFNLDIFPATA